MNKEMYQTVKKAVSDNWPMLLLLWVTVLLAILAASAILDTPLNVLLVTGLMVTNLYGLLRAGGKS